MPDEDDPGAIVDERIGSRSSDLGSTVRSAPSPTAAMSAFTSFAGSVTGTSPTWTALEKKMSPNDGAITTSKP